jgi:DNA polymerase III epsilon subunit-like protein
MSEKHIRLLEQSPIFRTRAEEKQELILDAVDLLARQETRTLPWSELRREMFAMNRYPAEWLAKELERTLEGCGVFRATSENGFTLTPLDTLETPIDTLPVVVMDLEATGGRPPLHRFVEVALIRRDPDGSEHFYESLANPRRPLPWYVTKITGLTERQVRDAQPIEDVMARVVPYLEGALLVFHGSPGDLELLNYELWRQTGRLLGNPVLCTICLTRELEPTLTTMGLDRVAQHHGITVETQHRAMDDALLTLQLYDRYAARFADARIEYLVDSAFFQGSLPIAPS